MARRKKQRKFKKSGELKGLKVPNNKGVAYLPSAKTIARRSQRPGLRGKQKYPTAKAYYEEAIKEDNNE